jgi:hypothetical protein
VRGLRKSSCAEREQTGGREMEEDAPRARARLAIEERPLRPRHRAQPGACVHSIRSTGANTRFVLPFIL